MPKPAYKQGVDGKWLYPTMPVAFVSCCDCGPDDFAVRDSKRKWRYGRRRFNGNRNSIAATSPSVSDVAGMLIRPR